MGQRSIWARKPMSLSLLVHELATNAIKYGALSVPEGRIDVTWHKDGPTLNLRWVETGGPPALEPKRSGLGSRLINMGLAGTGGATKLYEKSGLSIEFRAPLAVLEKHEADVLAP